MPKEVHYFLFSPAEVRQALLDAHMLAHPGAAVDYAHEAVLLDDGQVGVRARLCAPAAAGAAAPEGIDFAPPELLEAMIRYCRSRRIPLSRRSEKIVRAVDGHLALVSTSNVRLKRRKDEPLQRQAPGAEGPSPHHRQRRPFGKMQVPGSGGVERAA